MKIQLDSIISGIAIGLIVPILAYGLISYVFDMLTALDLIDTVSSSSSIKREKTVWLLAICFNLIPFNIFKNHKLDNAMRGIVFPTLAYVGYWLYSYSFMLFN